MSIASDYAEAAAQHRQRLLKRIRDLEKIVNAKADAVIGIGQRLDEVERIVVSRIEHLEAVVYAEGEPPKREDFGI